MTTRGLLFGQAALAYEQYRLGYPDEVADLVLGYAQPPVARALEVGAGTGKATRLFVARGVAVTACEPDPAMAAVLAERLAGQPVETVVATFEELTADRPYDLLYSAAAWHWTAPERRWEHAAELVRSGGTLAFLGGAGGGSHLSDPELQAAIEEARRSLLPDEGRLTEGQSPSGIWWPGSEIEGRREFADLEEHDLPRVVHRSREDYLGTLGTHSAYLQLEPQDRAGLFERMRRVLPDVVTVQADLRLHLARRV